MYYKQIKYIKWIFLMETDNFKNYFEKPTFPFHQKLPDKRFNFFSFF